MNFAFGTLLILILLTPGFLLRYAFLKGPYSRKNHKPSLPDEIIWSVIPAFLLQLSGYALLEAMGYTIALKDLYLLIIGSDKVSFEILSAGILPFMIYAVIQMIIAFYIGSASRWAVGKFGLDLRYNILKVNNEWYYLFSGQLADEKVEAIQLDILVKSDKGTSLYSGILEDYFLNSDGGIDRVYLIEVSRDVKYQMPGDYFVIFGREILNINVTYYRLVKELDTDS